MALNFLSSNLNYLRLIYNKTQSDIGLQVKKGHATVSNWEKGKNPPTTEDLLILAAYFNISTDELLLHDLKSAGYVKNIDNEKKEKNAGYSAGNDAGYRGVIRQKPGQTVEDFVKSTEYLRNFGDVYDLPSGNEANNLRTFIAEPERFRYLIDLQLPDLGKGIHFRFIIKEDSMHPIIKTWDKVVITYLPEPATTLREGDIYVFLYKNDVTCRRVYKADSDSYELRSENSKTYPTFKLPLKDIEAVFKVVEIHSRSLGSISHDAIFKHQDN